MASSIMHLAIAEKLLRTSELADADRFKLGCVMPDAHGAGIGRAQSHFITRIMNDTKSTYRLSDFRRDYSDELMCDALYLGYYLHLVQDMLFGHFVYDTHGWDDKPAGNGDRLHNDFALLNGYLIEKYSLSDRLFIPTDIADERLMSVYPFSLEQLLSDIKNDFSAWGQGEIFFFTRQMADEFIGLAVQRCKEEISALKKGGYIIDETEYAWSVH